MSRPILDRRIRGLARIVLASWLGLSAGLSVCLAAGLRPALAAEIRHPDLSVAAPEVRQQLERARLAAERALSVPEGVGLEPLALLAELYLAYGFEPAADDVLQALLEQQPRQFRALYLLAYLEQRRGETVGAVETLLRALELVPEDAPSRLRLGRLYLEAGESARAAAEFRRALAADSTCAAASYGLGQVAGERGDREAAVQHYRSALASGAHKSRADFSQVRYALGMTLRDLGRLEEAREELEQAAAQGAGLAASAWQGCADPVLAAVGDLAGGADVHLRRAMLAHRIGNAELELAELRRAVAADEANARAHRRLAASLVQRGDASEASEHLRTALVLEPDHPATHYDLGEVLRSAGELERAREHYREALALSPDFVQPLERLAGLAFAASRFAEASELYARVFELSDEHADLRVPYALALLRSDQREAGLRQLVLGLDQAPPRDPAQRLQLTEMLLVLGAVEPALERLRPFVSETFEPKIRARAHMWIGSVALGRGETASGEDHLKKALTLDPALEQARLLLEGSG